MERDNSASVKARPSATVVLVREGDSDPEILMVRRKAGDAFGDSYAFPGGVVDDDEFQAQAFCRGTTAEQADAELGLPSGGLDFYSAAVRELFEETGVRGAIREAAHPVDALENLCFMLGHIRSDRPIQVLNLPPDRGFR